MSLQYKVGYDEFATFEEAQSEAARETLRDGRPVYIYQATKTVQPKQDVLVTMTETVDWVPGKNDEE